MKKFIFIALILGIFGSAYLLLYTSFETKSLSKNSIEDRIYFAPSTYILLPSVVGTTTSIFDYIQLSIKKSDGTLGILRVPEWNLLYEAQDTNAKNILGRISLLPTDTKLYNEELNPAGNSSGFNIYSQQKVFNTKVLSKSIVAEKTLDSNLEIKIRFEIPYEGTDRLKFKTAEEARDFLEEMIANFNYNPQLFEILLKQFVSFDSSVIKPKAKVEISSLPSEVQITMLISELQQFNLQKDASDTLRESTTLDGFCANLMENSKRPNRPNGTTMSSLTCKTSDTNILITLALDNEAELCLDSNNFLGTITKGSANKMLALCR